MDIRIITRERAGDLNLPNEPFSMPGRMIPEQKDGIWSYRTELFAREETMCFPDENYQFEEISANGVILGAYEEDKCIGVAIFQDHWLKYSYLYDLKVNTEARGKGIGTALIRAGLEEAKKRGYLGIYCIAQDNNLNACRFYMKNGFTIGGFNNRCYDGTGQQGKADIYFYLR